MKTPRKPRKPPSDFEFWACSFLLLAQFVLIVSIFAMQFYAVWKKLR